MSQAGKALMVQLPRQVTEKPSNLPESILTYQEREVLADRIIDRLRADANNHVIQLAAELDKLRYENEVDYWLVMSSIQAYAEITKQRIVNDTEVYRAVRARLAVIKSIGWLRNRLVGAIAPELKTDIEKISQEFEAIFLSTEDMKREKAKIAIECKDMMSKAIEESGRIITQAHEDEKEVRAKITRLESQLAQLEQLQTQKLTEDPQLAQAFKSEQEAELNRVAEKAKIEITNFAKNFFGVTCNTNSVEDHLTYERFLGICLKSIQFLSKNLLKAYLTETENSFGQYKRTILAQSLFEHASNLDPKISFHFDAPSGYSDRFDEFPFEYFARILGLSSIDRVSIDNITEFLSGLQTDINQVDRNFYKNKDYFLKCKIFNRIRDFGQKAISQSMVS